MILLRHNRRRSHTRSGAALVEFCICLGFLVVMLLAIAQYGIIMTTMDELTQLDREAARWAAFHFDDANFTGSSTTAGSLQYYVSTIDPGNTIPFSSIVFPSSTTSTNYYWPLVGTAEYKQGQPIYIRMQYDISQKYFSDGFVPGTAHTGAVYITRVAVFPME